MHRGGYPLPGIESPPPSGPRSEDVPALAAAAITRACARPLETSDVHLVAHRLAALRRPDEVDRLVDAVLAQRAIDGARLAELGRWLCRFGVNSWQVASGLAILGVAGSISDRKLIARLGLLEAVTLYSVVALNNLLPEPEAAVFDLAKQVEGWGRIHAVQRLRHTTNPVIRDWLLRGGYDSGVMVEELAFIAVTAGGLVDALQGDVDDDLLDHAGVLLGALANGGPAEDMSDYRASAVAIELYATHMATARASLSRLRSLAALERYMVRPSSRERYLDEVTRGKLLGMLRGVIDAPRWKAVVEEALRSANLREVQQALWLAPRVGIDPIPVAEDWLERERWDGFLWATLLRASSGDQKRALIRQAELLLRREGDLESITRDDPRAVIIGLVVRALRAFPGEGWRLVEFGLHSYGWLRNEAIRDLETWPRDQWPPDAMRVVRQVVASEPDPEFRERLRVLADDLA